MTQQADEAFAESAGWISPPLTEPRRHADRRKNEEVGSDETIVIDLRDHGLSDAELVPRVYLDHRSGILSAPAWQLALKRSIDIATAIVFILLFLPLMVLTAIAVKLSSPGPVLYVDERVGKNGEVFRFAKFRSMRNGAHEDRHTVDHMNEVDGPIFKIKEDPRITPVGAVLRKFSIDELPQFFHVLKGTMSLVGPRPPIPEEVAEYDDWHLQRLLTKPGITCIWQVSGRSRVDFETWVRMDVEYIENWTPWLDMRILVKTIPAVLTARGAY
jgi:lipopolysaccharide/colanic/teichoic acid biosynthesis glycosyltransferase